MVNTLNHRRSIKNCVASHTVNPNVYFLLAIIVCTISLKAFGDEAIVVTKIAGNEYHIPAKYLGYPAQTNENDILLDAILPHMEAVDRSSKLLPESEKGNQVIILVHAASSTTSLEYRLSVAQKNYGPMHGNGNKFGLNAYVGSTEGIAPRQHDPSVPQTKVVEELYTDATQTSHPSLFIHCAGDMAVPSPGCDMVFISQDLLYEIHFQKHHVGEWQSIEQSAEKLVDSFRSSTIFSHPTVIKKSQTFSRRVWAAVWFCGMRRTVEVQSFTSSAKPSSENMRLVVPAGNTFTQIQKQSRARVIPPSAERWG